MRKKLTAWITAITLFAGLAVPVWLAAQTQQAGQQKIKHRHYILNDVGTFGGPTSYVNPASVFGSHAQINSRGTTVGAAATSIPTTPISNGFVCCGPGGNVPFVNHAFEWLNGVATDLGTLAGPDNGSVANAINARGEIVGTSENGVIDPVLGVTQIRAVIWKDGEIKDLGTFGGNHSAVATINNRGQVVGFALNAIPDPFSYYEVVMAGASSGTQTRAFLWQNGKMRDLGTLGGPDALALLLNDRGQVGGQAFTNSTPNPVTGLPTLHPFLWENGKMRDLGTLGGTNAGPSGLNNRGQVIGVSNLAGDQAADPFLWDEGKLIDLYTSTIGGNPITVNAINDTEEIVGGAAFPGRVFDAYVWKNGAATDLGTLDGDCYSEASAINSRGQVVGYSVSCDFSNFRGFLWENGTILDLNTRIPIDSSLQVAWALAINDSGVIGGFGVPQGVSPPDFETLGHAFVLTPVDSDHDDESYTTEVTQNAESPVNQRPMTATQGSPTSREVMARIHERMPHQHQRVGLPAREVK